MTNKSQRLELTWIGKNEQPKLEPRILIEDPSKSFGDPKSENMLIHGDNLLALKALEQDFAGKIKCIYIDPPFNTGQAFENYDDNLEHSLWLSLIRKRLLILKNLLSESGSVFIHIDDNELGYLIALSDEVFGRKNRVSVITFKQGSATGHKSINPGCITNTNFLLWYCKNRDNWAVNRVFVQRERNDRYNQFVVNRDKPHSAWRIVPLSQAFASEMDMEIGQLRKQLPDFDQKLDEFVMANADRVVQLARPNYAGVSKDAKALIDKSKEDPKKIYHLAREGYSDMYFLRGERIIFFRDTLKEVDGELVPGEPLTTLWDDIPSHNLHNEGGVDFPKSKKPEALIKRCLELTTDRGEIVLDSFAGSGTTGAVAHKMGRRWVMVELGDHAQSHCAPRMKKVISNKDESGVSKAVNWQGGGGFKFYSLAPSLLKKDSFGNWVIDETYNPDMLAATMAKHENYRYHPSDTIFWKQGQSTEKDFIYTTTQFVTKELIDKIQEQMQAEESLLICCKSFQGGCTDGYPNINVKKIPNMLLGRCEFGREDYSLNIINLPHDEDASSQDEPETKVKIDKHKTKVKKSDQSSLFHEDEE